MYIIRFISKAKKTYYWKPAEPISPLNSLPKATVKVLNRLKEVSPESWSPWYEPVLGSFTLPEDAVVITEELHPEIWAEKQEKK